MSTHGVNSFPTGDCGIYQGSWILNPEETTLIDLDQYNRITLCRQYAHTQFFVVRAFVRFKEIVAPLTGGNRRGPWCIHSGE